MKAMPARMDEIVKRSEGWVKCLERLVEDAGLSFLIFVHSTSLGVISAPRLFRLSQKSADR